MARVVVVHGIGQEFKGSESMGTVVGAALRDGMRLAGRGDLAPEDVTCAFYGNVFNAPGSRSGDVPPWDETDVELGIETDLLEHWWRAAAAASPTMVQSPDAYGTRGALAYGASRALLSNRVRAGLDALSASPYFAAVSDRMLILGLRQIRRYMTEQAVRLAARAEIAKVVSSDTRVIVAHSLGSVVAYEALCANAWWPVTDFVTVGSPLGMRSVIFDRLDPAPSGGVGAWPWGVHRWVNVADYGDVVALPAQLERKFGPSHIRDERIVNGAQMHDLARYLAAPKTGAAIADGLAGDPAAE
jgi:hypothetical protein